MAVDPAEQDRQLAWTFEKEKRNLLAFIRRRVPDRAEAEDLLQEIFFELVEAYRLMKPIAHTGAWMMQVARNRITDIFRRNARRAPQDQEEDGRVLAELLPSQHAGPDAQFARQVLAAEIEAALCELPPSQREVFIAHEIEGRSLTDMAAETGISLNTLLSRKRYATRRLRKRLQRVYEESRTGRSKA